MTADITETKLVSSEERLDSAVDVTGRILAGIQGITRLQQQHFHVKCHQPNGQKQCLNPKHLTRV